MKVKIFTEGGSDIGLGHVSRCCSLYDEVISRDMDVEFIIFGDIENIDLLQGRVVKNCNWLSEHYLKDNIHDTDYCIVDSYLASENLYEIISSKCKRALFIDDNARIKYPKSIVVNPSLNADRGKYPRSDENVYLLGFKYIILRNPFVNVERKIINAEVKEVLITMGGSDIRNLTPKIIKGICNKYPEIRFNIVLGDVVGNIKAIENIKSDNIEFYYNISGELMKQLMLESDFAITAAGQTIYELLATKTPFIPIKIIENQSNNIDGLRKINPTQVVVEYDDEFLIEKLEKEFVNILDYAKRKMLLTSYGDGVDGYGNERIIDKLYLIKG